jgi:hypothetical protein
MRRVLLIHWNAAEAQERADRLASAGYSVTAQAPKGLTFLKALAADPPAAVVIDLSRLPSQGRDVGLAIRQRKSTRGIALVFVGGDPVKAANVREHLPDAAYTSWPRIRAGLERALSHPPAEPIAPRTVLDGYSGRPLVQKLGIRPGEVVVLRSSPDGFEKRLALLPAGARIARGARGARGACDVLIAFYHRRADLERQIGPLAARDDLRCVWIAWPKKASGVTTDLREQDVREIGLSAGLVDYKICAIDGTYSGLLFTRRKRGR